MGTWKQPVINVTWEEAVDYTKWLSQQKPGHQYRLPSEREWESPPGKERCVMRWGNELGRNREIVRYVAVNGIMCVQ
ncbi:MAG: SUMF1/EgtB/PvdO family nonheme iron enzyme [Thiotrichaceae bacterium]